MPGAGREVDPLHERPLRLRHDDEHLLGVDGDLARPARARQSDLRSPVGPDHGRVDVAESVDLGGPKEADVDQAGLEVVGEQLEHGGHLQAARDQRGIADGQREPGWLRSEHTRLVYQLQVRGGRALGQIAGDVGRADPDEAHPLAGQLAGRGDDHHLGRRVGREPDAHRSTHAGCAHA